MSQAQYNLSTKTDYLNRKMFLDPAGPVTIQRFEEVKYNKLAKYEQEARGFFWVPEEISLSKDANDFKEASDTVKHIFTANLLRQTALDSLQGRGPAQVFTPVISIPELEALMYNWSFFETNIHSRSYSHIIRNIYNVPKDVFNTIHDTQEIVDMASSVGNYYDALHVINSNHRDFYQMAASYDIPFHHIPVSASTKPQAEERLLDIVTSEGIELVVLARYMQVLSGGLCTQLSGKAINIHHSFLPSFKGARPYQQAHDRGVKLIGATAHYVTTDLDEGPIIEQDIARVDHTRDVAELTAIGRDVESVVLARAVTWHAEHRVLLNGAKTVVFR